MMRFIAVAVLSLVLAGAAGAASSRHGALALGGMLESHGAPDLGTAPGHEEGELLRFIPHGQFQIGLVLENKTPRRLVVTAARVLEPPRTLIRQIGTHFHPWRAFTCPPGAFCPLRSFRLTPGTARAEPFAVASGKEVGVELDFQLGSCAQIPLANPSPIAHLRVTYRTAGGGVRNRVFPLGGAELRLRMPRRGDCAQPRSTLSVDGPQRYESSSYWTVPGSAGDVCAIRNGSLSFESRPYQTRLSQPPPNRHSERILLRLARFKGTGAYDTGVVTVVAAAGKQIYRSRKAQVTVTKATRREVIAQVVAGREPGPNTKGIPFRVSGTVRCKLRG